jgi:hypothetical protein
MVHSLLGSGFVDIEAFEVNLQTHVSKDLWEAVQRPYESGN